jgi:hypothetical protein
MTGDSQLQKSFEIFWLYRTVSLFKRQGNSPDIPAPIPFKAKFLTGSGGCAIVTVPDSS